MTKKVTREGVLPLVTKSLEKYGFKFLKSHGTFYGQRKDFKPSLAFAEVDTGNGVELRPMAGIRAETVENTVNRADAKMDPADAKYTSTLGAEIGRLAGDTDRWRAMVRTEGDFDSAAALMTQGFEQHAQPFYAKYSSLEAIDEHVNSDPDKPAPFCKADRHRAQVGVVVARLLHRADIAALIEAHRRHLRFIYGRDVPEFEQFLTRLQEQGE